MTELEKTIQEIRKLSSIVDMDVVLAQVKQFQDADGDPSNLKEPVHEDKTLEMLQNTLRQQADADEDAFRALVAEIPPDIDDGLFDIYEALAPDASRWRPFFLAEVNRLVELADASNRQTRDDIRYTITGMIFAIEEDPKLWNGVRAYLEERLQSPNPLSRRFAVILLGEMSPNAGEPQLAKCLKALENDDDWRIRYLARFYGNDIAKRPHREGIPLLDRLRARLSNPTRTP